MSQQIPPWFNALDEQAELARFLDSDTSTDFVARLMDDAGDNPWRNLMPRENGELPEAWWDTANALDLLTEAEKVQLIEDNVDAPRRPDGKYRAAKVEVGLIETVVRRYVRMAANELRDLIRSIESTWWVSSEIIEGITEAAKTHPRSPLEQRDMPSASGFARLATPLVTMSVEGYPVATVAVAWRARSDVFTTTVDRKLYGFPTTAPGVDYMEFTNADALNAIARVTDNPETRAIFSASAGDVRAIRRDGLVPIYEGTWVFDAPWDEDTDDPARELAIADGVDPEVAANKATILTRQWLATFWQFVQSEIFPWERPSVPRHVGRRIGRSLQHVPEVRVVDLRRLRQPSTPESMVDSASDGTTVHWHHSWIVHKHKRVLHRGTDKERTVWVRPYIKGTCDESRPLIVKDTVYRVRR